MSKVFEMATEINEKLPNNRLILDELSIVNGDRRLHTLHLDHFADVPIRTIRIDNCSSLKQLTSVDKIGKKTTLVSSVRLVQLTNTKLDWDQVVQVSAYTHSLSQNYMLCYCFS